MKCEFVMAMLHRSQIVFLDEPIIGLAGVAFILTTHDLDDVEHLTQRVIVINHGNIMFDHSIDRLRSLMGTYKMVQLTAKHPMPLSFTSGIRLIKQISNFEAELEDDKSMLELNDCIKFIHDHCGIGSSAYE